MAAIDGTAAADLAARLAGAGAAPPASASLCLQLLAPTVWSATWFVEQPTAVGTAASSAGPDAAALRPALAAARDTLRALLHPDGDEPRNTLARERLAGLLAAATAPCAVGAAPPRVLFLGGALHVWPPFLAALRGREDAARAFTAEWIAWPAAAAAAAAGASGAVPRRVVDPTGEVAANYGLPG